MQMDYITMRLSANKKIGTRILTLNNPKLRVSIKRKNQPSKLRKNSRRKHVMLFKSHGTSVPGGEKNG